MDADKLFTFPSRAEKGNKDELDIGIFWSDITENHAASVKEKKHCFN